MLLPNIEEMLCSFRIINGYLSVSSVSDIIRAYKETEKYKEMFDALLLDKCSRCINHGGSSCYHCSRSIQSIGPSFRGK
jgi:hypothetical protein